MSVKAQSGWAAQDQRRFLHAVYRVGNKEASKDFYTKALGMKVLREKDYPDQKFYNLFVGYGDEDSNFALELTYNYDVEKYDIGQGFSHFGLLTQDVNKLAEQIKANGGKVSGDSGTVQDKSVTYVEDPTGWRWALTHHPQGTREPLSSLNLNTSNLDKAVEYYTKGLGMKLLKTWDSPDKQQKVASLGYGDEENDTVLELTYTSGKDQPYEKGNGYAQLALSTNDVYKTAEEIKAAGFKVTKEPFKVMDVVKVFATEDPDGYKYVFVDNEDFLNNK